MNFLGDKLRKMREDKGLLLRQVAAYLEVDTAFISKLERGERKAQREQVLKLAEFLDTNSAQLIELWLTDKIAEIVKNENNKEKLLNSITNNIKNKI